MHVVTGGSGYFGNLLVAQLLDRGERVRVFDILDADDRLPEVEFLQGDIRDKRAVANAVQGADIVHHNVAMVPLAKDKGAFWSVNSNGTLNLLEACHSNKIKKVVYTSSSAVFGVPEQLPIDEYVTPRPAEAYGKAKLAGEEMCWRFANEGLDVSIIRPRTIMGHGRLGIMQMLFDWIREGRNVPVFDGGHNKYQFVHADDLAAACILSSERPEPRVYNIGADCFGTMRETLQALVNHAQTGSRVKSVPSAPAVAAMKLTSAIGLSPLGAYHSLMYGQDMYFDGTRAHEELGWSARYSNEQMFCESYDWYLKHRDEVLAQKDASHHRSAVKQGVLNLFSRIL
ncbi:MAG: NAD-dependent epimerase/dehydratase family protein [Gammaproteobacteria bacterium]|nr:NAD-dependent epimerase/dehydratase family protein [Gammaproteobacteria bacterium]MCP4089976.1 NAD-dependent epimerase/dehydratase family protein [Gammaproteobacteria bacterium]MCP4276307.1 NAD-dependent epimerase/dehydratase family protein [Gammaproteobacteria bacterium]MCP4831302.1 NAD-dependent epimerase/dehydratase family protein [Gammaproteobacteria bacterium]MCP4928785.1 NAD-dependent epimerase/dehydratase family protein [Gammaproteobacteria bacterium]